MIQPKYSNELEQRVLENLMDLHTYTNIRAQKAILKLTPDCFYKAENAEIYGYIHNAFQAQESFMFTDILVKISHAREAVYNAFNWIMENYRTMHVNNRSLESDVEKLVALRNLRNQITLTGKMLDAIEHCAEPLEAQTILNTQINEIATMNYAESKHGIDSMEIAEAYFNGEIVTPQKIETSSRAINLAFDGGIMPKSLIFIAAGSGVGKTGFSIFLMDAIGRAQPGSHALFFSIEMEYKHIWMRHIGVCAGKPFDQLSDSERLDAVTKSAAVPVRIYDTAICRNVSDLDFILTTARLRAMEQPVSVIVVDYLGLVQSTQKFERHELKQSYIVQELSKLAIQLDCTILLLSQINRGAANRDEQDRCPWPQDASDSSGGHKSSSYWLGVDRPELYRQDSCFKNQFVVKCRKNRFGDIFELNFAFNGGTFAEVPQGWFKEPTKPIINSAKASFSVYGDDF